MLSTADERRNGRQREGSVLALMGAVQREEKVVIVTAKSAYGQLLATDCDLTAEDTELVALESRCRAKLLGEPDQDLDALRLLPRADHQTACLEDATLLGGDGLHRGTQEPLVVKSDRRH